MKHYSDITKEEIEEKIREIGVPDTVIDHGNGWYTINAPGMTVKTNKFGLESFNKAMEEEIKKLNNDRTK